MESSIVSIYRYKYYSHNEFLDFSLIFFFTRFLNNIKEKVFRL